MDYTKEDIYGIDLSQMTSSITVSNTGTSNVSVTSGASITVPWNTTAQTSDTYTLGANWSNQASAKIRLDGPDADIEINGASLTDMIEKIEQRLAILKPDPRLEKDWDELRELGDRYRALEKEIIEKQKMWDTLKK